jgi:predicted GH43/DUF377 family glycosyl hydrolase
LGKSGFLVNNVDEAIETVARIKEIDRETCRRHVERHFTVHPKPFLFPASDGIFAEYEAFGIEDLRICPLEGEYLLTYSAYSRYGRH